jgi:alkylation response protein AidB-like acyl-CoA dehydrogenase
MDFAFSNEQEQLRASARAYLADHWPVERVLEVADAPATFDRVAWGELAALGWLDPELGVLEYAVLAEESAYALLAAPWWATVALAGPLLDAELRQAVAAGTRAVTLAQHGMATLDGDRASGRFTLVPDLASVTDVVFAVGESIVTVDLVMLPGVVVPRSTMDRTRRLGELHLNATPVRRLDVAPEAVAHARHQSLALAASEAVGVAQRALDLAADYAKSRQQFGRVIGTYQAVSHRIADTFVTLELSRSLAYWAAWTVSERDDQQSVAVAAAKAAAASGAMAACEGAIQVHGGMGFTWEHVLHRYYKRAQWLEGFHGYGPTHRAVVADAIFGRIVV